MTDKDTGSNLSIDGWLEPASDGMYHITRDQVHLPEDYDTPATPAQNPYLRPLPPDHPLLDSNIDITEAYDEGLTAASDIWEQHSANDRKGDALYGTE